MTDNEKGIFFELLRASIWESQPQTSGWKILSDTWDNVLQMMSNHDLLGVVAHTVMSLPFDIMPNPNWQMQISMHVASLTQTHDRLNSTIVELFEALDKANCHPLLLKGQGIATLYPKTCLRSCGDIDCYVGMDNFQKSKDVMQAICSPEDFSRGKLLQHQFDLQYKGVTVELHRRLSETPVEWYEKKFQRMFRTYLGNSTANVSIANSPIRIPDPQCNALYVFIHLAHHYAIEGIGFRQFIDWAMLLYYTYKQIDIDLLKEDLKKTGNLRAWQILSGILHYQLGMDIDKIPLYDSKLAELSQSEVLIHIINGWNFGKTNDKRHGKKKDYSMSFNPITNIKKLKHVYSKSKHCGLLYPNIGLLNMFSTVEHALLHRWQKFCGTYVQFDMDF